MLNIHVIGTLYAGYKSLITLKAHFMHYGEIFLIFCVYI